MRKIIFILIVIVYTITNANAMTLVPSGPVSGSWTLLGSPYIVLGNIWINQGGLINSLTISSGVEVVFTGNSSLTVFGTLIASGSPVSSCSYSYTRDVKFDGSPWSGIIIDYTGNMFGDYTTLDHCEITGVQNNPALQMNNIGTTVGTFVSINCCSIHDNTNTSGAGGIFIQSSSSVTISNNRIFSNSGSSAGGIYETTSNNCTITGNNIVGNASTGNGGGVNLYSTNQTLSANTIDSNTASINGGGISIFYSGGDIESNYINYNNSSTSGAGIYISSPNAPENIENNNISYNNYNYTGGTNYGGGVYIENSYNDIYLYNNTINYNFSISGGGLYLTNSYVMVYYNIINHNKASQNGGGGLIYDNKEPVDSNTINYNTSGANGGGLYVIQSTGWTLPIENNIISFDSCNTNGGGLYYSGENIWVRNNTISDNSSGQYGGGIFVDQYSYWIENNNINTNNAVNGGGIFYQNIASGASPLIRLNYISKNTSTSNGGGLYISSSYSNITVNIINNLFDNNNNNLISTLGVGGGIYLDIPSNSGLNVNNNTIADNIAYSDGAGIYSTQTFLSNNPFHFDNNILWGNTINGGIPNSANNNLSDYPVNDYPSFHYCDIAGITLPPPNSNITIDPSFAGALNGIFNPYELNGQTDPYHTPPLWVYSPCIDVGDNYVSPIAPTDIEGSQRITYAGWSLSGQPQIDMGAFENYDGTAPMAPLSISNNKQNKNDNNSFNIYPNPFQISTNINFTLNDNNEINIEIYDMTGKSVEVITDKSYTEGNYTIKWENKNLSKGVYICKMTINYNKILYKKLIIE